MNLTGKGLLLIFFLSLQLPLNAEEQKKPKVIRAGVYNNHPKVFMDENGKPAGIFIDILETIAEKENLRIEYVPGEWNRLIKMLASGEIDLLPDVSYSKKRASQFALTTLPVIESWLEVFTLKEKPVHSVFDLQNKKIGVLKGSIQENYMKNTVRKNFNLHYEIFTFHTYENSLRALKEGLVGALVTDRFFYFSDLYDRTISPTSVIFRPAGLHFAFSRQKNGNLSKIFDKHISILKNDPESLYYHSLQRWFGKRDLAGIPKYLIWLFIIIAVILSAVLLFALLLKKQVKLKTATLRRKNEELQSAKRKVEESNRLKTVFLQNISHEIRTPMNGILGFLKLLKNQGLDSENKKQYVDIINQSAQRLLETISNIVEISKIESNQVVVHSKPVNVREVMDFNLNFFKQQADKKGIHIRISTQIDEKNSFIKTDPALLNDILSNLINNAIKFTPAGEIEIGNYRKNGVLVFFVKDTGIGIPADRLDIIFDRFVQAEQKPHRAFEGSGLGLSIVKAYIQQLGGEIWVESTPGRGSTFSFSIPYLPANRTETKPKESGGSELLPRKPLIILVAEDDEISFLLLEKILKQPNITLLHAPDGQSAVRLFSEAPHISLILMDLKMPGMDGLEAARLIRKKDPQIPIIAQTAFEFSEDKERALEAGCNAVITKPINPGKLIRLIKQYAR